MNDESYGMLYIADIYSFEEFTPLSLSLSSTQSCFTRFFSFVILKTKEDTAYERK